MKKIVVYLAAFLVAGFFYLDISAQTTVDWPAGKGTIGRLVLGMKPDEALFRSVAMVKKGVVRTCLRDADPVFMLRVGTRDLVSQHGWNLFFDKVRLQAYTNDAVKLAKGGM